MIIQDSAFVPPTSAKPRASAPAALPPEGPADSVTLGGTPASAPQPALTMTPSAAMKAMTEMGRIQKEGHQFRVAGCAQSPDGTATYVGYREGSWYGNNPSQPGYVASVAQDGTVRWEAAIDDVLTLGVDAHQDLHVVTAHEHLCLAPDGAEKSRTPLPCRPSQAWVSPGEGSVYYLDDQHRLATTGSTPLPEALAGQHVTEFLPARDGSSLAVRAGSSMVMLAGDGTATAWHVPPATTEGKMTNAVTQMRPLADGNVLCTVTQTIEVRSPHRFRGGGGFGFGGGLMDHEPDPGEWITRTLYRKIAPDGTQMWQTTPLDDQSTVGASADGTVYCTTGDRGAGNTWPVLRVKDDGSTEPVTTLGSQPRAMHTTADALWVWANGELKGIGRDGAVVDGSCPKGWTPMGVARDQRLLVQDQGNAEMALLDPRSGALTRLTDTIADHSLQRQGELERIAATMPPPDAHAEIREEQDWIVIGNVRVPKNPS